MGPADVERAVVQGEHGSAGVLAHGSECELVLLLGGGGIYRGAQIDPLMCRRVSMVEFRPGTTGKPPSHVEPDYPLSLRFVTL